MSKVLAVCELCSNLEELDVIKMMGMSPESTETLAVCVGCFFSGDWVPVWLDMFGECIDDEDLENEPVIELDPGTTQSAAETGADVENHQKKE
jgi:hypothetical protein